MLFRRLRGELESRINWQEKAVDIFIVLLLYAVFGFLYATSRNFPPASLFFVELSLWALFVLNTIYLIKIIVSKRRSNDVVEDEKKDADINPKRVLIVIGINLVYIFILIPYMGFYIASIMVSFGLMYSLSLRRVGFLILIPILLPLIIYIVFERLLHIPLGRI